MKMFLAAIAMIAMLGFIGSARADDAKSKPKVHKGHLVKVEGTTLTYKGGAKGKGKEYTVNVDASAKVTLDGNDVKLSDLKEDIYIEVTTENEVVTSVKALTHPPAAKPKKGAATKPTTQP